MTQKPKTKWSVYVYTKNLDYLGEAYCYDEKLFYCMRDQADAIRKGWA